MNEASSSKLSSVSLVALVAILAVVILVPGALAAGRAAQDPATILVKFTVPSQAARAIAAEGDRHLGDTPTHVALIQIDARRTVGEKVAEYAARTDVVYAEPNYIAHAYLAAPSDPSYGAQWGFGKIQVLSGWSIYPGSYASSGGATLAVVDTGVQASHPDLGSRVRTASGATCLTGTCVARPGYGRQRTRYARRRNRRRDDEQWRRRRRNVVLFIDRAGQGPGLNRFRLVCQRRERHSVGSSARRPCDESQPRWERVLANALRRRRNRHDHIQVVGRRGRRQRRQPPPGTIPPRVRAQSGSQQLTRMMRRRRSRASVRRMSSCRRRVSAFSRRTSEAPTGRFPALLWQRPSSRV